MTPPTSFRFGPFRLNRVTYRLHRDATPIDLGPKALDLLLHFVTHPDTLVTKDDMLAAVWPDVAVTDNALTQVVSDLRQALGDRVGEPQYIQTVARRGYRFIAPVEADVASETPAAPATPAPSSDRRRAIVVSDFTDLTGESDLAWLGTGIAETLTNDLRAIPDLRVLDRSAGEGGPAADVLLLGSIQRAGSRIRITARAVDAVSREVLTQARADGELSGVFGLQDAIVRQISDGLRVPIPPAALARIASHETASLDAYRSATEGRLRLETLDPNDVPAAVTAFTRALDLDPYYALAHVGLAHALFWRFQASRARSAPDVASLMAAIGHAAKAIDLDGDLAEAHSAMGFFLGSAERTAEALAAGRRALTLEPGQWRHQFRFGMSAWGGERLAALDAALAQYPALAHARYGAAMVHLARGDFDAVQEQLRAGIDVLEGGHPSSRFPASGLHWMLGLVHAARGEVAAAYQEFEREGRRAARHLLGGEFLAHACAAHGGTLLAEGDSAAALERFESALAAQPDHPHAVAGIALASRRRGEHARAATLIRRLEEAAQRQTGRPVQLAMVRALAAVAADRFDAAETALHDLVTTAPAGSAGWTIPVEPLFAPLRARPSFRPVLARLAERAS